MLRLDIDLDATEWRYTGFQDENPAHRPLSCQAVEILWELHPLIGRGWYAFPSARNHQR